MCTEHEGKVMMDAFRKYRKPREVEAEDKPVLDLLVRAALITYSLKDGRIYAQASPIGRKVRYNPLKALFM